METLFACSPDCASQVLGPDRGPSTKPCDCWNALIGKLRDKIKQLDDWRQFETAHRCRLVDRLREVEGYGVVKVLHRAPVELRGGQPGEPCKISPFEVTMMEHNYALEVIQELCNELAAARGQTTTRPMDPSIQCVKCGDSRHVLAIDIHCRCCGARHPGR